MLSLNTNIEALKAGLALQTATAKYTQAAERISTGLRINSAKDDPAGLGLANRLKAKLGSFTKAVDNVNQGIAMVQTVDTSLKNIASNLSAMRNLALSSASGTTLAADRAVNQTQFASYLAEMSSIVAATNYNGKNLLDGTTTQVVLQTDSQANGTLALSFSSALSTALGENGPLALTSLGNPTNALASGDLVINGYSVGASLAADDTSSFSGNSGSAIAKVAAINRTAGLENIVAAAGTTTASGSAMTALGGNVSGTVTVNGVAITLNLYGASTIAENRAAVVTQINAQAGQTNVRATDGGDDTHGVILTAADGRNITVSYAGLTKENTGLAAAGTYSGNYTLRSLTGGALTLSQQVSGNIANAGFAAGTYQAKQAQSATLKRAGSLAAPATLTGADLVINGYAIRAAQAGDDTATVATVTSSTKASSAIAMAAAINDSSRLTGVTAVANPNVLTGTGFVAADVDTLFINGQTLTVALNNTSTLNDVVGYINGASGSTGVTAVNNGSGITLTAALGQNISLGLSNANVPVNGSAIGLGNIGLTGAGASSADAMTYVSTVKLKSDAVFSVTSGTAGKTNFESLGFREGTYGGASDAKMVASADISTATKATAALSVIDSAIDMVSGLQARAGAQLNRLDYRKTFLAEQKTNTTAAYSSIMDANYAEETANLASSEILKNAATAILAQANLNKDIVSYLLKMK
jgi:flagellin